MPQLDFFSFPHQYLVASICFCGLYYFNLIYFFNWIKYLFLIKIFSIIGFAANQTIVIGDYSLVLKDLLALENDSLLFFKQKTKKLQKHFFLKRIGKLSVRFIFVTYNNILSVIGLSFLILFFFFKNFLVFNAEKLMLIYFLFVVALLFFFLKKLLRDFLEQDIWNFLVLFVQLEQNGEKILNIVKSFYLKLREELVISFLEFFLTKNFEIKVVQKVKW